ncbi:MAG: hypothetical protein IE916_01620 [Epsilonproteobacteria bacterium]|nr:hypothetical protein [Campylobacterota bacterium]
MKKIGLSLIVSTTLLLGATNEELEAQIKHLQAQMQKMQTTQESMVDEIAAKSYLDGNAYEGFSSMGGAASKVYYSKDALSIGGYGEYKYTKYMDYKNYSNATANDTRNKGEMNIVRFVPYIGFKFNDSIVMNTEIEFEDGGARSDGEKNYKYAIVEFSYLDFLIDKSFAIRVGHVLTPMGLTNLNHEPVAFLTTDRPLVETWIIPSTWHTNGLLVHGEIDEFEYYAGLINSPDAGGFTQGRFIQQGRGGAKVFSDDYSFVARLSYEGFDGLTVGASVCAGNTSAAAESSPGAANGVNSQAKITLMMAEAHAQYKKDGWNIQALAAYGSLAGDVSKLSSDIGEEISSSVNGQYLTVGYDVMPFFGKSSHAVYAVGEIERLDMDASGDTTYADNNRFFEYSGGIAYYPDPKVIIKADYKIRDYAEATKLADEQSFAMQLGFIF